MLKEIDHAETLTIRNCNFTAWKKRSMGHLKKLRKLVMENNSIEFSGIELENLLDDAVNLEELEYINNKQTGCRPDVVRDLKKLKKMVVRDISNCADIQENTFNNTALVKLEIAGSNTKNVNVGAFNGLDKLEDLNLERNKLASIPKDVFVPLKSLKTLNLRKNIIEKFCIENLPELQQLEEINLSQNPLTELSLKDVQTIAPKLKIIDVTGTKLTEAQILDLTKSSKVQLKNI
ncbi:hypothetical protein HHI36_015961 [Cryptolaemus montrouzieri]|uniref:Uncharacterized protein n=1 Tax=Cryptolaemus montrouzieri TaxID=559131 RepID=A0ABD2N7H1_9CUCU